MAQIGADQRIVLLLYEALIVLLVRSAAGEDNLLRYLVPEEQQLVVEELRPVVGVNVAHRKGQANEDAGETIHHRPLTAAQQRHALTPSCGYINHLEAMHIMPIGYRAAMVNQIDFEVAGLRLVPRNEPNGHSLGGLVGRLGRAAGDGGGGPG